MCFILAGACTVLCNLHNTAISFRTIPVSNKGVMTNVMRYLTFTIGTVADGCMEFNAPIKFACYSHRLHSCPW